MTFLLGWVRSHEASSISVAEYRDFGEISALVMHASEALSSRKWMYRALAAHHGHRSFLPASIRACAPGELDRTESQKIAEALDRLEGHDQYSIQVAGAPERRISAVDGSSYLAKRLADRQEEERKAGVLRELIAGLPVLEISTSRIRNVLRMDILLKGAASPELATRIEQASKAHETLVATGPWPAISFRRFR